METGAIVPGYSGGVAACMSFSCPNLEGPGAVFEWIGDQSRTPRHLNLRHPLLSPTPESETPTFITDWQSNEWVSCDSTSCDSTPKLAGFVAVVSC